MNQGTFQPMTVQMFRKTHATLHEANAGPYFLLWTVEAQAVKLEESGESIVTNSSFW